MTTKTLMVPGPMPLHPEVARALASPMLFHRGRDFQELFSELVTHAKNIFKTENDVLVLPCSGTGGLEAVVANLFSPKDSIIVAINGFFGERVTEIAAAYGVSSIRVCFDWGCPLREKEILEAIDAHPEAKALVLTHIETSTGVISDIEMIAHRARMVRPDILIIVDAVSSLGGTPVLTDAWQLDVVVCASQKALMGPPGVAFVCMGERAWKQEAKAGCPRYYFNLRTIKEEARRDMTFVTPAVPVLAAVRQAFRIILETGLEKVFQHNAQMRDKAINRLSQTGLELLPGRVDAAPTVTAIKLPHWIPSSKFRQRLEEEFGVVVATGLGPSSQQYFRIGHMGYVSEDDVDRAMSAIAEAYRGMRASAGGAA